MTFNPKQYLRNYFKKKSIFGIVTDFLFIALVVLLINPSTRTDVGSLFIKLTSLPPSTLDSDETYNINKGAQDWVIYDLDGNEYSFKEMNEKPVFLNFWATWCPPCVAELPSIQDLYVNYKDEVNFILISNEEISVVKAFAAKKGYENLKFYVSKSTPIEFYSQSIPTTFVISKEGEVVVKKKGAAKWNSSKMNNILENLLVK